MLDFVREQKMDFTSLLSDSKWAINLTSQLNLACYKRMYFYELNIIAIFEVKIYLEANKMNNKGINFVVWKT